jgi:hypothetical protein
MQVRVTFTFDEDSFTVLRWLFAALVRLHAEAPSGVQITTEVDRG